MQLPYTICTKAVEHPQFTSAIHECYSILAFNKPQAIMEEHIQEANSKPQALEFEANLSQVLACHCKSLHPHPKGHSDSARCKSERILLEE